MGRILKTFFEWLTGTFNLFDNYLYNYAAIAIVGFFAFVIAWNFVGYLYKNNSITGSTVGTVIHWIIWIIAFVVFFSVISFIIWIVKLILSIPVWVWWSLLGTFVLIIIGIIVSRFLKKDGNLNEK